MAKSKWTKSQWRDIEIEYQESKSPLQIEKKYGMHVNTLYQHLQKRGISTSKSVPTLKSLSIAECAYIAGFIDGEGRIGIDIKKAENSNGCRRSSFVLSIYITNTNRKVLEWMFGVVGFGAIYQNREEDREHNCKATYVYRISTLQAIELIKQVLPYLIIKKKQAQLLLKFDEIRREQQFCGRAGLSEEEWQRQYALYQEMKRLNRKGCL